VQSEKYGRVWSGGIGVDKSQAKRFCYKDFGWMA
jgi:hypothetical protein